MLIGILVFFLFGSSSSGLVVDITKPVKQVIEESARANQIITINKDMLKEEATFAKAVEKAKKQLAKLNRDRLTPAAEFGELLLALDQRRTETFNSIVADRFKMKELMTAAEWSRVYSLVSSQK